MKVPLRYQNTEYDCGTTTFINALAYLYDREEIPVELSAQTEYIFGPAPKNDTRIYKALEILEGEEKEVYIHLIIEGYSVKETADIMNVNINRIYYLKKLMEKDLQAYFNKK